MQRTFSSLPGLILHSLSSSYANKTAAIRKKPNNLLCLHSLGCLLQKTAHIHKVIHRPGNKGDSLIISPQHLENICCLFYIESKANNRIPLVMSQNAILFGFLRTYQCGVILLYSFHSTAYLSKIQESLCNSPTPL